MKSSSSTFFAVGSVLLAVTASLPAAQTSLFIFETSASVAIHLTLEETQLSTADVYNVEVAATSYFRDLITQDESLRFLNDPKNVLKVAVDIEKQTVDENQVVLNGNVGMVHYGDQGIIDLAALLTFLVNKNNTDSNYVYLDQLTGMGATVEYVDFFFVRESVPLASNLTLMSEVNQAAQAYSRSGSEKTLIVVVTFLSITLIALASVLCWIGGGWLALRRQVKILLRREEELTRMTQENGIHPKGTAETDDDDAGLSPSRDTQTNFTDPSGILGVNGMNGYGMDKLQGLGIKTPGRTNGEIDYNDLATPMSMYSDSDRAPIGIMSMRKLVGPDDVMPRRDDADSEGDQDVEDDCDIENFGMKKLEY